MDIDTSGYSTPPRQDANLSSRTSISPSSNHFICQDFQQLKNMNNFLTSSSTNTPVRRMISSSRVSSEVTSDSVYTTPTKTTPDNYSFLRSPSRNETRSGRRSRHRYLTNHHRKLRNQPSKLDMLDSGFTSFPIDPPQVNNDTSTNNQDMKRDKKRMILVEDYIEENRRLFGSRSKNARKISVLDFKKSLKDQQYFDPKSPSFSTFSNASMLIRALREGSELETVRNKSSLIDHRSFSSSAGNQLASTYSSSSTVRDESFGINAKSQVHGPSPASTATEVDHEEEDGKKCVICECEFDEFPATSHFKELVCFECTEEYEHIVNLINNDVPRIEEEDEDEDSNEDEYDNLRPISVSSSYELPSSKKQCNVFDNVFHDGDYQEDNFSKIYQSLKKIQENNNKLLIQRTKKKRFHNPLLKVPLTDRPPAKLNFDFNELSSEQNRSAKPQPRSETLFNNLKESLEKFRRLTATTQNDGSDRNEDLWIRAKRIFNWYRQSHETDVGAEEEVEENFIRLR